MQATLLYPQVIHIMQLQKEIIMKKSKLNLIIDALLTLCIAAIVGIGLLIKYVLVPGYQRWEIYERNVSLFLWGLDRHQWGTINFILGLVFSALLILHIVLHWPMIIGIYRRLIPNRLARWTIAFVLIFVTLLLIAFPYLIKPEVIEHGQGKVLRKCEIKCDIPRCSVAKRQASISN